MYRTSVTAEPSASFALPATTVGNDADDIAVQQDFQQFCASASDIGQAHELVQLIDTGRREHAPALDLTRFSPQMVMEVSRLLRWQRDLQSLTLPEGCSLKAVQQCIDVLSDQLKVLVAPGIDRSGAEDMFLLLAYTTGLERLHVPRHLPLAHLDPRTQVHALDESAPTCAAPPFKRRRVQVGRTFSPSDSRPAAEDAAPRVAPKTVATLQAETRRGYQEPCVAYARRLYGANRFLGMHPAVLVEASGARLYHIQSQPWFKPITADILFLRSQLQRRMGEFNASYARRLWEFDPRLANDLDRLSLASGLPLSDLRKQPWVKPVPPDVQRMCQELERRPGEKSMPYAKRLVEKYPELRQEENWPKLSIASQVGLSQLTLEQWLKDVSPEVEALRAAVPRMPDEPGSRYARRLAESDPSRRDNLPLIAHAAGITLANVKLELPVFRTLSALNQRIQDTIQRGDSESEPAFCRRLVDAHPWLADDIETLSDISRLPLGHIKKLPFCQKKFGNVAERSQTLASAHPRLPEETNWNYAVRLATEDPNCLNDARTVSAVTGLTVDQVWKVGPRMKVLPQPLAPRQKISRLADELDVRPTQAPLPDDAHILQHPGPSGTAQLQAFEVKQEPMELGPLFKPREVWVFEQPDMMTSSLHREIDVVMDITGDKVEWSSRSGQEVLRFNHPMTYDPAMDHEFPIRSPLDPMGSVHPAYAGSNGQLSPKVRLLSAKLSSGAYSYLRALSTSQADQRLPPMHRDQLAKLCRSLEEDVAAEMRRLIAGTAPQVPRCQPRTLMANDLLPHERMLIGQQGLFALPVANPQDRPIFTNGKILCVYMGALMPTAGPEIEEYRKKYPGSLRYEMDVTGPGRKEKTYSSAGASNSGPFANTALLPGGGDPAYDHRRINTIFVGFDVTLIDKNNKPRTDTLAMLVALENLFSAENENGQVFADYGDIYLEQFKKTADEQADDDLYPGTLEAVKREPVER